MFRIKKIYDSTSELDKKTIQQVQEIFLKQFPLAGNKDLIRMNEQLRDPMKYQYRSILFVAENQKG